MSTPSLNPRVGSGKTRASSASSRPGAPVTRNATCQFVTFASAAPKLNASAAPSGTARKYTHRARARIVRGNRSMMSVKRDHGRDRTADAHQHSRHLQLLVRAPQPGRDRRQAPECKPQRQQARPR